LSIPKSCLKAEKRVEYPYVSREQIIIFLGNRKGSLFCKDKESQKGGLMSRIIKETKCTCQACGNTWYYGKQELWNNRAERLKNVGKEMENAGSNMMCCGGCLPAVFIPEKQKTQVRDLDKCSKCNSSAIQKEEITHEV